MIDFRFGAFLFCIAALAYGLITLGAIFSAAWGVVAVTGPIALVLAFICRYLDKKDRRR